jgi:hypothetical protein
MFGVVQRQHGGSFMILAWDLGITLFDSLASNRGERASPYFQECSLIVHWVGSLEDPFYEGLIGFLQYVISLPISSI